MNAYLASAPKNETLIYFMNSENWAGVSAWSPSLDASPGLSWTSTVRPSAPHATAARLIDGMRLVRPVPWAGSTITGRCVSSLIAGTALRSSVLRV